MNKEVKVLVGIFAGILLLKIFTCSPKEDEDTPQQSNTEYATSTPTKTQNQVSGIEVGQPLHTRYFDVTVNNYNIKDRVSTGNQFADLGKEEGTNYLIIDISFKNTDKETRTMLDGVVLISNGDNVCRYEQSEPVMLEGWGLLLDNINPGITKRTKLVYKIPADITGTIFYNPARADNDQIIRLGSL